MTYISDKINRLKQQKKEVQHNQDLEKLNRESEKNYIDQQIDRQKDDQIKLKKQQKQNQKKLIVQESRELIFQGYNLLRKMGIIQAKEEYSRLFNRHKSYFLMLEGTNQGIPLDALVELKRNLNDVCCQIRDIVDTDDPVFHDWAKNKLQSIISGLEHIELKILKELYDVS